MEKTLLETLVFEITVVINESGLAKLQIIDEFDLILSNYERVNDEASLHLLPKV